MPTPSPYTCFAIAAPGLEPILARELTALGERSHVEAGGVSWRGDARSMMRANLWLRTASRVLVRVARFRATAFHELERRAKRIPWGEFLAPGTGPDFRVTARKSRLYHSDAIAQRLLEAAGSEAWGSRSEVTTGLAHDSELTPHTQLFVVRVLHDEFEISADTSGDLLHMRGYRQSIGKAPIRETLAAALLLGAEWDGRMPLMDPFCGSGTIPIEAALLARNIAPGSRRAFAFMRWPNFDHALWQSLLDDARAAVASAPVSIHGSDRDAGVIAAARDNAERAGVAADIDFSVRALSAMETAPAGRGLVASNPPYGVRVSERKALKDLYARFGQTLRARAAGWRVALYSPARHLEHEVGLPFQDVFSTSNGGIRVNAVVAPIPELSS